MVENANSMVKQMIVKIIMSVEISNYLVTTMRIDFRTRWFKSKLIKYSRILTEEMTSKSSL